MGAHTIAGGSNGSSGLSPPSLLTLSIGIVSSRSGVVWLQPPQNAVTLVVLSRTPPPTRAHMRFRTTNSEHAASRGAASRSSAASRPTVVRMTQRPLIKSVALWAVAGRLASSAGTTRGPLVRCFLIAPRQTVSHFLKPLGSVLPTSVVFVLYFIQPKHLF